MKFSIITITFNSARYLAETMESVLSQDYVDLEYILVDGGSTDGTLDIIRRYADKDKRLRWISEPDKGIADAFNKGLALARGELVGILNSDDTYCPGALRKVADTCSAHPDCDVFHGDMMRYEGDTPLFLLKATDVAANIWHEMPVNHPATFVTRRAYDKVGGFDVHLRYAMDYDLVLRLYRDGCSFRYIPAPLAAMRYGGASDTKYVHARREVYAVTVREGYPRTRACFWFAYKVGMGAMKNLLRKFGLHGLIRLHPRFRAIDGNK